MGRKMLLCLLLFLIAGVVNAGEWVPLISLDPAPTEIEVVSSSLQETVLLVSLPGYFRDEVRLEGQNYTFFSLQSGHNMMDKGCPSLPFEVINIAIAPCGSVSWSLEDIKTVSQPVDDYVPSKGHFTRDIDPATIPYTFSAMYKTDAPYPSSMISLGDPFILRNIRGVNVAIRPFQFNPIQHEMTIATSFKIKVNTSGTGGPNILKDNMLVPESFIFQDIYERRFINYKYLQNKYPAVGEIGNMIIIANDSFYTDMLPFYYWKLQKGIPTKITNLSSIGSTVADVQAYIQSEYDGDGVTFVLLVGDADEMPYPLGTSGNVVGQASDPSYMFLAGGDIYPDAFVSRFPAQTTTEVQTMVNRVINYEKTPQSGGSWYHKAFGIAGDDTGGSPPLADWERMDLLKVELLSPAYYYTVFDEIYHSSATAAQVTTAVNDGRGLGEYIGHGSITAWSTTGFDVSDVYALNNPDQVPYIISVACLNGRFNYSSDCFGESWQKAGTPAAPTGALAIYASSTNQSWVPPCDAQTESVDLMVTETYHTVGALSVNGCMGGMDLWPGSEAEQLYQQWHIFGDCSAMIYTDTPTTMSVTHDGILILGQSTYTVTVTGVQDALCALYDDATHTLYGSNYTDASGQTTITLNPVPTSVMTLTLTVTAFNKMPFFDTVDVIVPSGPWLKHDSHIIDDSAGNGDGIINPGESIIMPVTLENIGADPASSVSATLATSSTEVTITDNYADYPDIAVSMTGQSLADHYSFDVSSSAPEGHTIPFTVTWSAAGGYSDDTMFNEYVCEILTISNISVSNITTDSATITWDTNVPADSTVTYGSSVPPSLQGSSSSLTTSHSIEISGLNDCSTYYFSVNSVSPNCYSLTDDNGGTYYDFTTMMLQVAFFDDMETGIGGWTTSGLWHQVTEPTCTPSSYSPSTSWYYGQDASCDFDTGSTTSGRLYSAGIDIVAGTELSFWYRRDTECGGCCTYDNTSVQISTDGGSNWTTLEEVCDDSGNWVEYSGWDLSAYAGQNINIGFYFDSYDSYANTYLGWMIDDVMISKPGPCIPLAEYNSHTFTDTCTSGGPGDGDGIIDAGEMIEFQITIDNIGVGSLTGVWGELTSSTTGVTIVDGQADYPDILEGNSATSLSPHFTISLADTVACGSIIDFTLTIHSNEDDFIDYFSEDVGVTIPGNVTALDESFEGSFPPTGWTVVNNSGDDWDRNDVLGHGNYTTSNGGSGYCAATGLDGYSGTAWDTELWSPSIDLTSALSAQLTYASNFQDYAGNGDIYLDISTNGGSNWNNIRTQSVDDPSGGTLETEDLSAYIGNTILFRWHYIASTSTSWYWHIDNVTVDYETTPDCQMNTCLGGCNMTVDVTPNGTTQVCEGSDIVFTATASNGTAPFDYQWTEDGSDISGATGHTYTANYTTIQSHNYNCKVTDSSGVCSEIEDLTMSIGEWITCSSPPPPVADGVTGVGIELTKASGDTIHVDFDVSTCNADHAIMLYGSLSDFNTYSAAVTNCDVGVSGSADFDISGTNVWFNLVWVNAVGTGGHPGFATSGDRLLDASGFCGVIGDDHSDIVCD